MNILLARAHISATVNHQDSAGHTLGLHKTPAHALWSQNGEIQADRDNHPMETVAHVNACLHRMRQPYEGKQFLAGHPRAQHFPPPHSPNLTLASLPFKDLSQRSQMSINL